MNTESMKPLTCICSGTVLIGKEAQPKLEALLENALSKNPENSGLP